MKKLIYIFVVFFVAGSQLSNANPIQFTNDWKTLNFFRIPATQFMMKGKSVDIIARKSSSVIYRTLDKNLWNATSASWIWETSKSVPPTDLSKKGDDDRNISIYFVFLDRASAERIGLSADIKTLLTSKQARIVIYSFGGDKARNTVQKNPYLGNRGVTIIKRSAKVGFFEETVDLANDYKKAFGSLPEALVGIALASDSDDTGGLVVARIESLRIE
ncbi:MAG: DUF3047 domain-containing protein [Rhizobiaceae bacterium]|nr:DUF3047 domain-containing protein [Rhizobiaceae bacterium]